MLLERAFRITNSSGDIVRGDFRCRDDGDLKPLVLICHGFNTNKDWGPFPFLGKRLAEEGFCTIVFNFSHNGVGEASFFSEYDRFARNTPGKELIDVQAILDAVTEGEIGAGVADPKRIGMAGHSRGGGISILTTADDKQGEVGCRLVDHLRFPALYSRGARAVDRNGIFPITVWAIEDAAPVRGVGASRP